MKYKITTIGIVAVGIIVFGAFLMSLGVDYSEYNQNLNADNFMEDRQELFNKRSWMCVISCDENRTDTEWKCNCNYVSNNDTIISWKDFTMLMENRNIEFIQSLLQGEWNCYIERSDYCSVEIENMTIDCENISDERYCMMYSNGIISATLQELERWEVEI